MFMSSSSFQTLGTVNCCCLFDSVATTVYCCEIWKDTGVHLYARFMDHLPLTACTFMDVPGDLPTEDASSSASKFVI